MSRTVASGFGAGLLDLDFDDDFAPDLAGSVKRTGRVSPVGGMVTNQSGPERTQDEIKAHVEKVLGARRRVGSVASVDCCDANG